MNFAMYLMQIFIPTRDNDGGRFPEEHYTSLRDELTGRFGGATIYARSPVEGIWKKSSESTDVDQMIIYEVLADEIDNQYWKTLKSHLETLFRQEEILMRYFNVTKI
ncbi:hypothetical protein [Dyadobacter sp. MSC1_007]|jgi:hypothetical protein|uniref:hypothetical protein n=1 Tax=Dyadobacter sp. MSC1_007 TaxID=2909264 RepID=UPI00202DE5FB|nr:hypothetical protein [Dyadobacter sp. MSC1_007]